LKIKAIYGIIITPKSKVKRRFTMLIKGDRISILPEYRNKGEEAYIWVVVGDEEKGRVDIGVLNSRLTFPPIETVPVHMVKAKRTDSGRKVSIRHGRLKEIIDGKGPEK